VILGHTGDYIPNKFLTPYEIIFNKPHPSILLHIKDASTQKILSVSSRIKSFSAFDAKKMRRISTSHPSSFDFSAQQDPCTA
jgi:hypothetical protein